MANPALASAAYPMARKDMSSNGNNSSRGNIFRSKEDWHALLIMIMIIVDYDNDARLSCYVLVLVIV